VVALALAWMAACSDGEPAGLPDSWSLSADGIQVEVQRAPFSYLIRDGAGVAVLRSLADGDGQGYAALAWNSGALDWEPGVMSPGHLRLSARLDDWRESWSVVAAEQAGAQLDLVLGPADDPEDVVRQIQIRFALRPAALRVEARKDHRQPRAWAAGFVAGADEGYLGFGERFTRTDQRGLDVYSWAEEGGVGTGEGDPPGPDNPYPHGEPMTYYPMPFFVSTAGYAFWLDSTWHNTFHLASDRADAWRVWHIGPDLAFELFLPDGQDARPWPYQLIDAFTARVGRPMIPPKWSFGPRRRINRGDRQTVLVAGVPTEMHELEAMRALDLAISGLDDSVHFLPMGSHVGREAALADWTAFARSLGVRVCGYYNPYVGDDEDSAIPEVLAEGIEKGYFLVTAGGELSYSWLISGRAVSILTVDFTNPAAVAWYQSLLDWALELGYSGWMYDFGEYVQPDVLTFSGWSGEQYHNQFPVDYHKACFDHLEAGPLAGQWLAFSRSGYTGDAAYAPMTWAGDPAASFESSDGLPSMVRAGLNLGICGAPHWGGDINGFHCAADGYAAADEELLVRWIQQGAMSPNMQDQDACSFALDEGRKANIFDDPLAQQAWRTYARLHTRLFPYLYSLAVEAHQTGAPLMRHMFLEHPQRAALAAVDDAYYLGPALLVAPVVERGARSKTLELPAGLYLDWAEQLLIQGGDQVVLDAPLEKLPLLLRDGYLLPMLDASIDTLAEEDHPEVIGPSDVSGLLDVVGLVSTTTGGARLSLYDGGQLQVEWQGGFAPPALSQAASPEELSGCSSCWLRQELGGGLARVRISAPAGVVTAGGLRLNALGDARVRWDLYLVE
jgi:alpha-glucosidase (family GH31 glycosyl hydrolase)